MIQNLHALNLNFLRNRLNRTFYEFINYRYMFNIPNEIINKIFIDLAVHPDRWYDFALFAKVYAFLTIIDITPTSRGFGLQGGALFKCSPDDYLVKCHDCYQVNPIIHDSYKLQRRHFQFRKITDFCLQEAGVYHSGT
jgi:hypothetical protein